MTFKPSTWYPVAVALSALNLVGVGFAAQPGEALHVAAHAALALAFGVWAQRLSRRADQPELGGSPEPLELEMSRMRDELNELQERLDFTERMLAQGQKPREPDARFAE